MKLFLLRHATVAPPNENCYNGWNEVDITPFTKIFNLNVQAIYSSDLIRCKNTLHSLGIPEFMIDKRLREIKFKSSVEGKCFSQLSPPRNALMNMQTWFDYICDESYESFRSRVRGFLIELEDVPTLLCTHRGTICMIQSIILELDFHQQLNNEVYNLQLIKIDFTPSNLTPLRPL